MRNMSKLDYKTCEDLLIEFNRDSKKAVTVFPKSGRCMGLDIYGCPCTTRIGWGARIPWKRSGSFVEGFGKTPKEAIEDLMNKWDRKLNECN